MVYSKILKIANIFDNISSEKCAVCGANGTVFNAENAKWYCDNHGGYCEYCKKALIKEDKNRAWGADNYTWLHPDCQEKLLCPNCKESYFGNGNDPVKDFRGNIIGCEECVKECDNCSEYGNAKEMVEHNGDWFCRECFDELYTYCDRCGEYRDKDEIISMADGDNTGCTECAYVCDDCGKGANKEDANFIEKDDKIVCNDCFSEGYAWCNGCHEAYNTDDGETDDEGNFWCESCFNENFVHCYDCGRVVEVDEAHYDDDGDAFCDEHKPANDEVPYEYIKYTNNFHQIKFNPYTRNIRELRRLVPISIKELKTKHSKLANSFKEIIKFAKGKDITDEILNEFNKQQPYLDYRIGFSGWNSDLQRSVEYSRDVGQLVLHIIAPPEMLSLMQEDRTYELFKTINEESKLSEHPMIENQIGWARLELNEDEEYILVDEIQSDHMNVINKLIKGTGSVNSIENKLELSKEELDKIIKKLKFVIKSFPSVITEAISAFAKQNGFKKLYWHTYESGNKLKGSRGPRSLYTIVPKKNYFKPTSDKPFDLDGKFLARLARRMELRLIKIGI